MADRGVEDPLAFLQLLIGLLEDGRRTATYKLAVLLALTDCCASASTADGHAPLVIPTPVLTRRVVELYWPQVRPYPAAVLRQSSQARATTVDATADLRTVAAQHGATTLDAAERVLPNATAACLSTVELNLVQMPLGKLQRPSGTSPDYPRFLYDDAPFHERVTRQQLDRRPLAVHLEPGVGDWLIALAGLVRPVVELHWARDVARFSRLDLPEDALRDFLFGTTRAALRAVQPGLHDMQRGLCFYCGSPLRERAHVDHFLPWSRVPNDGLANLVVAHERCNLAKSDHLADLDLLERWYLRPAAGLRDVAEAARWPLRRDESLSIARSVYGHQPAGSPLWSARGVYALLDATRRDLLLPRLSAAP